MDLYNIPGDNGKDWRLKKFVEYQHEVPSIHYRVLGEYIKKYVSDKDRAVMMCWYMSCTYNEITCVLLDSLIRFEDITKKNYKEYFDMFWKCWKDTLDFGSSRKYAKSMDWFPTLMCEFTKTTKKKPYKWLKTFGAGEDGYRQLFKALEKIPFVGRFAAELFMESVLYLNDYFDTDFVEPSKLDWKRCSNLTSGLLNIFYMDEEANYFDKTGKLPVDEDLLTEKLKQVQNAIFCVYPEQKGDGINLFVGKICSFRNLFKNSRYGGFHHDRELGVLLKYKEDLFEYEHLWSRLFELRKEMFHERFLGELNDWSGIRKERKKLFLTQGKTGVEMGKNRLLVNIRGCNGAGKSTIPMSMMDDPDKYIIEKPYKGKQKKILTVFPRYKWIVLGTYLNKTGGMDTFPNNELTVRALIYAIKNFPEYDVLMEGIMCSTIYSTYKDLFLRVEKEFDLKCIIVNFIPPYEVALERVYERNGGKSIKEDGVKSKYETVKRNHEKFKKDGFKVVKVDTSKILKEDMLSKFLKNIERYRNE